MYQYKLESQVKDRLVFVHSELSPHYYSSARFKAAFFQRESEPISKGTSSFHGTGQFNVFHIINPSPNLRVIVDFSRTSLGAGRTLLPQKAIVVGDEDYKLPFVGAGSARVISPVIKPEYYEGQAYITIDFGDVAHVINKLKTGLMRWYGVDYALDDRRLIGFTRDISVITDEQYRAMPRPTKISRFPRTSWSTRGWSTRASTRTAGPDGTPTSSSAPRTPARCSTSRATSPTSPASSQDGVDATISINDRPTEVVNLKAGKFTLTRLIKESSDITSISLHFSDAQVYDTDVDKREMSAYVNEISINDISDFANFRNVANAAGEKFVVTGIDDDGWIAKVGRVQGAGLRRVQGPQARPRDAGLGADRLERSDGRGRRPHGAVRTPCRARHSRASTCRCRRAASGWSTWTRPSVFALPGRQDALLRDQEHLVREPEPRPTSSHGDGTVGLPLRHQRGGHRRVGGQAPRAALPGHGDVQGGDHRGGPLPVAAGTSRWPSPRTAAPRGSGPGPGAHRAIRIPLSRTRETTTVLSTDQSFPLAAPDMRMRSYRVVNIDFD
jgi:hypothetical protein